MKNALTGKPNEKAIKIIKAIIPKAIKPEKIRMTQELTTTPTTKERAVRRDKGQLITTPRDVAILKWINEQQAISIDHLQILMARITENKDQLKDTKAVQLSGASKAITRWLKMNYVETAKINNRVWIWCSAKAIKILDLDYGYYEPTLYNHMHEVNKVRLYHEGRKIEWTPERYIRKTQGKGHRLSQHFPDGEIIYRGNRYAIEVELSQKRGADKNKIAENYKLALIKMQNGKNKGLFGYHYEGLIYYTNEKTHEMILKTYEGVPQVQIRKLSEIEI